MSKEIALHFDFVPVDLYSRARAHLFACKSSVRKKFQARKMVRKKGIRRSMLHLFYVNFIFSCTVHTYLELYLSQYLEQYVGNPRLSSDYSQLIYMSELFHMRMFICMCEH